MRALNLIGCVCGAVLVLVSGWYVAGGLILATNAGQLLAGRVDYGADAE